MSKFLILKWYRNLAKVFLNCKLKIICKPKNHLIIIKILFAFKIKIMHVYLFNGNKYNKTPEEISIDFNFWNEKLIAYIYIYLSIIK